jgi:AraC-like DNA-binding protein
VITLPERILDPSVLLAAVLEPADDAERARALDEQLRPLAREPSPEYLELLEMLAAMLHDRTLIRVEQVAAAAGRSSRSLQRLFAAYIGIGPKAVLARYRLHDAVDALDRGLVGVDGGVPDLAALAAELGWFDQAHFSRDFRAAVGTTPTEYLRSAQPPATDGRT